MAGGAPRVALAASYTPNATAGGGGTATASFSLQNDGDIEATNLGNPAADIGDWVAPKAAAGAAYECRMSVDSGTFTSGTTGSWLALDTTRAWTKAQTGAGNATCQGTLEIRRASDGTVLTSSTVSFEATVIT